MESPIVDCNGAVSSRKFGPSQIKEQPMKEVDREIEEKKICNMKCFQMDHLSPGGSAPVFIPSKHFDKEKSESLSKSSL